MVNVSSNASIFIILVLIKAQNYKKYFDNFDMKVLLYTSIKIRAISYFDALNKIYLNSKGYDK